MTDARQPFAVALGMFDGMHIGHRQVIDQTVKLAKERGWASAVYTFENHPRSVFAQAPAPLMTSARRRQAMLKRGVDVVDMVRFDRAMAALEPREFLTMLCARYDVRAVVVGSDYTYGHLGKGTVETLRRDAPDYGFEVHEVPFVMLAGEKVSSTRIRSALDSGNTALAREMLGESLYDEPRDYQPSPRAR